MAASHPAPGAQNIDMTIATPGKDASDPNNKPAPKRALFSSPPAATHMTNTATPSTTEIRNTRESHIVIIRGGYTFSTSEQFVADIIKLIDADPTLESLLKSRPLEMMPMAFVKITTGSLDGTSPLLKHKHLAFMKEGLQNTQAMFVIPKSACIGALATVIIGYLDVYQRIHSITQCDESGWAPWMKYVAGLFGTGTDGEFDMSFERSLDRHKDKLKYYADAMALGFASWALPHVTNALISALRIEFVSEEADLAIKNTQDQQFTEFRKDLKESLLALGVQGPERDDGWVA